jgi:hypothetical protein
VVLIWGSDAAKLMEFVYKNRKAYVWIELKEPPAGVSVSGLSLGSAAHFHFIQQTPWKPSSPTSAPSHMSCGFLGSFSHSLSLIDKINRLGLVGPEAVFSSVV